MFTGIIRHLGTIDKITHQNDATQLAISSSVISSLSPGDSLAVNGVCLTVLNKTKQTATFRLMQTTLQLTNLGQLRTKDKVNLELPLTPAQPIDGHFVMGHIDGLAKIIDLTLSKQDKIFTFRPPRNLLPYLISKGSVALDGVSLTIVDIRLASFTVSMMPYTLRHTIFGRTKKGYRANLEIDVLGKYVARLVSGKNTDLTKGSPCL